MVNGTESGIRHESPHCLLAASIAGHDPNCGLSCRPKRRSRNALLTRGRGYLYQSRDDARAGTTLRIGKTASGRFARLADTRISQPLDLLSHESVIPGGRTY